MERFAFLVHPLNVLEDVGRKYPIARYMPERWVEWALKFVSPKVVSHITGVRSSTGAEAEGWFVGCPLTPRQFLELDEAYVLGRIIEAGRVAARLGAGIVGLGAFTAVVGDAGITVAKNLDIAVTTGNSYTVATALEAVFRAAELMDLDVVSARSAVLGATGAIGSVCTEILARRTAETVLIGRDPARLEALASRIAGTTGKTPITETDVARGLAQADLVVTVSSAVEQIIKPEHLKPGAVVCDVARPRDVSEKVAKERDDVLVIEGGVVQVPGGVDFGFDFGFPPGTAYACMAETMMLALEGTYQSFTLGRAITLEQVEQMQRLAQKHGFRLAGFRSFERAVTEEHIARIRENAKRAQHS